MYTYIYNYLKYALATLILVPHASSHNQPHPNSWEWCAADVHWNLHRAVFWAINSCRFFGLAARLQQFLTCTYAVTEVYNTLYIYMPCLYNTYVHVLSFFGHPFARYVTKMIQLKCCWLVDCIQPRVFHHHPLKSAMGQDVVCTLSGISWNHLELRLPADATLGQLHLLVKDLSMNGTSVAKFQMFGIQVIGSWFVPSQVRRELQKRWKQLFPTRTIVDGDWCIYFSRGSLLFVGKLWDVAPWWWSRVWI